EGYWRMSTRLASSKGMRIDFWDGDFRVPSRQMLTCEEIAAEMDLSSAFALAAIAAVAGSAGFLNFPSQSLQPDAAFLPILQRMGVPASLQGTTLKVEKASGLHGIAVNLKNAPDLFPVLAALCALAKGESDLYGAPHLIHKESDRLGRMAGLLEALGRKVEIKPDGLVVRGHPPSPPGPGLSFDCDQDHRLAFAAAVLKAAGFAIEIQHPEVVSKSFPEYWSLLGWNL
ncbi:MAG: 3-phosphoshikimate 1-carboxyvinyltransferase, partial [Bdellovibrionales bacterium]